MKTNILFLGICFGLNKYRTMAETINETSHFLELIEEREIIKCIFTATKFLLQATPKSEDKIVSDHDAEQKITLIRFLLEKKSTCLVYVQELERLNEEIIPNLCKEQKKLLERYLQQDCDAENLYNQILYKDSCIKDMIKKVQEREYVIEHHIRSSKNILSGYIIEKK